MYKIMKFCIMCKKFKELNEFSKDKNRKDGYLCYCKCCWSLHRKIYHTKYPWKNSFNHVKQRCNNPKNQAYKNYGGRGIKCLITEEEIKKLWFRDKAYLMDRPSIDRIDNDGNYTYDNCRFIELKENVSRAFRKSILQFDLNGNFIKEWNSIIEASKILKIFNTGICNCLNKRTRTAGGFMWRYKNGI